MSPPLNGLTDGENSAPPPPAPRVNHCAGTPDGVARSSSRSRAGRNRDLCGRWRRRLDPLGQSANGIPGISSDGRCSGQSGRRGGWRRGGRPAVYPSIRAGAAVVTGDRGTRHRGRKQSSTRGGRECPVLSTQYSVLSTQYPVFSSVMLRAHPNSVWVLGTGYWVLGTPL